MDNPEAYTDGPPINTGGSRSKLSTLKGMTGNSKLLTNLILCQRHPFISIFISFRSRVFHGYTNQLTPPILGIGNTLHDPDGYGPRRY